MLFDDPGPFVGLSVLFSSKKTQKISREDSIEFFFFKVTIDQENVMIEVKAFIDPEIVDESRAQQERFGFWLIS
jgi:hypothetical protein